MAKALKSFDFGTEGPQYDWAKFLDGSIFQLTEGEGEDYTCKTLTFLSLARAQARKAGKTLKTATSETGCVIQAVEADKAQLQKWAEAAAEKKAAKAAAKNGETPDPEPEPEPEAPAPEVKKGPGGKKK